MALPLYLAMTAAEFRTNSAPPTKIGWMACHFSPYATGLSNFPSHLPEGSMLILNDRTPICGHDPDLVVHQLRDLVNTVRCDGILLDFQRPGSEETDRLARKIVSELPCPVAISDIYAFDLPCPVFLPPVPVDTSLETHIAPWIGREIWLEAAMQTLQITLTPSGAEYLPLSSPVPQELCHADIKTRCHYTIETGDDAVFTLWRTKEDLLALLEDGEKSRISRAVGLYQELGKVFANPLTGNPETF